MKTNGLASTFAVLAAALYAINVPFSKLLLDYISPTMMASFLYLGAGLGMLLFSSASKLIGKSPIKEPLTRKEFPYTLAMVLLDIAAPILLMLGVANSTAANVSLLNNFEIVATSLIALFIFKEAISRRLALAFSLVVVASIVLGFEGDDAFSFGIGSIFVLGACVCWGFENNCTRMISSKSTVEIVIIKGIFSGLGSMVIALFIGEKLPEMLPALLALLLGFVSYGLSINFYIKAQKHLGAAKTSAFYSIAPFLGVSFSILLGERPQIQFYIGLVIMVVATIFMVKDSLQTEE